MEPGQWNHSKTHFCIREVRKSTFFSKRPHEFFFETSSWILAWNPFLQHIITYWDIFSPRVPSRAMRNQIPNFFYTRSAQSLTKRAVYQLLTMQNGTLLSGQKNLDQAKQFHRPASLPLSPNNWASPLLDPRKPAASALKTLPPFRLGFLWTRSPSCFIIIIVSSSRGSTLFHHPVSYPP